MCQFRNLIFVFLLVFISTEVAEAGGSGWTTSVKEAVIASKKTGRPIVADFTGSDWCGWCVRLNREVFDQGDFKKWAQRNVILLELDYPKRKEQSASLKRQNQLMRQRYRVSGYPTILILGADGKLLQKTGYKAGGPKVWVGNIKEVVDQYKAKYKPAKEVLPSKEDVKFPEIIKKEFLLILITGVKKCQH